MRFRTLPPPPFRTLSYKRFSLLLPLSCSGTGHSIKVVFKSCWNLSRAIVSLIARQDSKYRQYHQLQLDMGTKTTTKNKFRNKAEEKLNLCDTLPDTWFGKRWLPSKTHYRIPRFRWKGLFKINRTIVLRKFQNILVLGNMSSCKGTKCM